MLPDRRTDPLTVFKEVKREMTLTSSLAFEGTSVNEACWTRGAETTTRRCSTLSTPCACLLRLHLAQPRRRPHSAALVWCRRPAESVSRSGIPYAQWQHHCRWQGGHPGEAGPQVWSNGLFEPQSGAGGTGCGRADVMSPWLAKTVHGEANPAHGHHRCFPPLATSYFNGGNLAKHI
jgi:hypothetical protein